MESIQEEKKTGLFTFLLGTKKPSKFLSLTLIIQVVTSLYFMSWDILCLIALKWNSAEHLTIDQLTLKIGIEKETLLVLFNKYHQLALFSWFVLLLSILFTYRQKILGFYIALGALLFNMLLLLGLLGISYVQNEWSNFDLILYLISFVLTGCAYLIQRNKNRSVLQ